MKTVLFACVHNAGRSQMAATWFNQVADPALAIGISAGTQPSDRVHPEVLATMREVGFDLQSARPQLLTDELMHRSSLLITMGCGEQCPFAPGLERRDWALADPKGLSLERVREIRDEIRGRVISLVEEMKWAR